MASCTKTKTPLRYVFLFYSRHLGLLRVRFLRVPGHLIQRPGRHRLLRRGGDLCHLWLLFSCRGSVDLRNFWGGCLCCRLNDEKWILAPKVGLVATGEWREKGGGEVWVSRRGGLGSCNRRDACVKPVVAINSVLLPRLASLVLSYYYNLCTRSKQVVQEELYTRVDHSALLCCGHRCTCNSSSDGGDDRTRHLKLWWTTTATIRAINNGGCHPYAQVGLKILTGGFEPSYSYTKKN